MRGEIVYFTEPLGNGRAVLRRDVTYGGVLVETEIIGSPAPIETVRKHEKRIVL